MDHKNAQQERLSNSTRLADGLAGCQKAPVEQRWDECSLEEKIERLRIVTRNAAITSEQAAKEARKANEIAHMHEHGADHKPVMPICRDPWNNPAQYIVGHEIRPGRTHLLD